MDNRTLIAVLLSILVLLGFNYYEMKQQRARQLAIQQQAATNAVPAPPANAPAAPAPAQAAAPAIQPQLAPAAEKIITVDTDLYTAKFSSIGGVPISWTLKKYKGDTKATANREVTLINESASPAPLAMGWGGDFNKGGQIGFTVAGGDLKLDNANPQGTLSFVYSFGGINIRRTYTFKAGVYTVGLTDEVSGTPDYTVSLGPAFGIYEAEPRTHTGPVLLWNNAKRTDINPKDVSKGSITYNDNVKWIAQEDKYFCAALVPLYNSPVAQASLINGKPVISYTSGAAAGPIIRNYTLYAGPKSTGQLKMAGHKLDQMIDFGFFSPIALPIFWLLKKIHSVIGNWGWAIVALTLLIRIPFIPLVMKSQKSMKKLQAIQPKMNEIRQKFKKDPQRMQKEMTDLYRKHKVNPIGGCLPMLLQVPVFFALYKVLLVAIALRGAPFILWIHDLSQFDPYYILPISTGITMFIQQKMTPTGGDPAQQKMMLLMPVIFTVMFLKLSAGLNLYWMISNLLSILQQLYVNKRVVLAE